MDKIKLPEVLLCSSYPAICCLRFAIANVRQVSLACIHTSRFRSAWIMLNKASLYANLVGIAPEMIDGSISAGSSVP